MNVLLKNMEPMKLEMYGMLSNPYDKSHVSTKESLTRYFNSIENALSGNELIPFNDITGIILSLEKMKFMQSTDNRKIDSIIHFMEKIQRDTDLVSGYMPSFGIEEMVNILNGGM